MAFAAVVAPASSPSLASSPKLDNTSNAGNASDRPTHSRSSFGTAGEAFVTVLSGMLPMQLPQPANLPSQSQTDSRSPEALTPGKPAAGMSPADALPTPQQINPVMPEGVTVQPGASLAGGESTAKSGALVLMESLNAAGTQEDPTSILRGALATALAAAAANEPLTLPSTAGIAAVNVPIPEKTERTPPAATEKSTTQSTMKEALQPGQWQQAAPPAEPAIQHGISQASQLAAVAEQVGTATIAHGEIVTRGERIELHLQLEPPELGTVTIHLSACAHNISARLVVHEEAARQLIEQNLQSLRQQLADAGIRVGSFSVARGDTGARSSHSERRHEPVLAPEPLSRPANAGARVLRAIAHGANRVDVLV
jgi:flagellar hook-length control protein FliK